MGGGAGVKVPPASGVAGVEHLAVPAASFWARARSGCRHRIFFPRHTAGSKVEPFSILIWQFLDAVLGILDLGAQVVLLNDHERCTYEIYAVPNVLHLVVEYESQRMCRQGLRPIVDRIEGVQSKRSYDFIEPNDRLV